MKSRRPEKSIVKRDGAEVREASQKPVGLRSEAVDLAAVFGAPNFNPTDLMEAVVERSHMIKALVQVERNKGDPGVDGLRTEQLRPYFTKHWGQIKQWLLGGEYKPSPVRRVEIPKPDGGVRELGIPTCLDRVIQQAIGQLLGQLFEPTFSGSSYGFRPKRSAHQAVAKAHSYASDGKRIVVDLDLARFFDRVNHDILMERLSRRIKDKRMLKVIRRYLEAGVMIGGLEAPRTEGTLQGGRTGESVDHEVA